MVAFPFCDWLGWLCVFPASLDPSQGREGTRELFTQWWSCLGCCPKCWQIKHAKTAKTHLGPGPHSVNPPYGDPGQQHLPAFLYCILGNAVPWNEPLGFMLLSLGPNLSHLRAAAHENFYDVIFRGLQRQLCTEPTAQSKTLHPGCQAFCSVTPWESTRLRPEHTIACSLECQLPLLLWYKHITQLNGEREP